MQPESLKDFCDFSPFFCRSYKLLDTVHPKKDPEAVYRQLEEICIYSKDAIHIYVYIKVFG